MSSLRLLKREIPWIVPEATIFLKGLLTKDMSVLEFGSGGSTIFFARRTKNVVSYENNIEWYDAVKLILKRRKINNVNLILYNPRRIRRRLPVEKFNCILIDPDMSNSGIDRDWIFRRSVCMLAEYPRILVLDNYSSFKCSGISEKFFFRVNKMKPCKQITFNDPQWYGMGTRIIYDV